MRFKYFLVFFLLAKVGYAQSLQTLPSGLKETLEKASQVEKGAAFCATPLMTSDLVQKAIENTKLHSPRVYESILRSQTSRSLMKAVPDTVGMLQDFFVLNRESNQFEEITFELRAVGITTQVWVDTTELGNGHVTQSEVDEMITALEDQTPATSRDPDTGIVELNVQFFGPPPDFDDDDLTDFLITDIKDDWTPGSGLPFTVGFFFPNDQTFNTGSNERDILYIDSFPTIFTEDEQRRTVLALLGLAHEFQHLIHHNFDSNETTFLNEGFSHLAEAICGYGLTSPAAHYGNTDVPLFDYNNFSGNQFVDRSRAGLFSLYLNEQFGDPILRQIVAERANGVDGINIVFNQQGLASDVNQVFVDFSLANYISDRAVDTKFGYNFPISGRPTVIASHTDPTQDVQNQTVHPLAVDYHVYSFGDSLKITFTGGAGLEVKAIKTGPGLTEVEDVPVGSEYLLPEFGSSVRTVVFAVLNLGSSLVTYSYSSTGVQTGVLAEISYDDGTPDVFSGNAAFLGFGNDRPEFGWAVKFIPEVPQNKLVSAQILAAFDQEFQGSSTPADASKDFLFHIWDSDNGIPGNDIISPFIVTTNRAGFGGEFLTVDLSSFEAELVNLDTVYIGFTENDSVGTFLGMDNSTAENFTFGFFGPTHETLANRWLPMSDLVINSGGTEIPLAGFNMMIRAAVEYVDTSSPTFAAGFFQNPIFTERLDLFVVGSTKLNPANLSATLGQGGSNATLSLSAVPNAEDRVFVDNNVTLTSSGTLVIQVQGTTKFGSTVADSTFSFNAELMQSEQGGVIASTDGRLRAVFPENSLKEDTYLIAFVGNSDILNSEISSFLPENSIGVYTVSPVGYQLSKPANVEFHFDPAEFGAFSPEEMTLAFWDSDRWTALESSIDLSHRLISTEVSRLGHYAVMPSSAVTDIQQSNSALPSEFALQQNYPNPFNPSTHIRIDLPEDAFVQLRVYDLLGRTVRTLLTENKSAGTFQVSWNGRDDAGQLVNSGVYFYRVTAGDFQKTMKMILVK